MNNNFSTENNNIINTEQHSKNNKQNGEYVEFYPTGNLFKKCNYKDGKLDGEYTEYHLNGNVYKKCNYVDGKLYGNYKSYYADGTLYKQHYYIDDNSDNNEYETFYSLNINTFYKLNKLDFSDFMQDERVDFTSKYKLNKQLDYKYINKHKKVLIRKEITNEKSKEIHYYNFNNIPDINELLLFIKKYLLKTFKKNENEHYYFHFCYFVVCISNKKVNELNHSLVKIYKNYLIREDNILLTKLYDFIGNEL